MVRRIRLDAELVRRGLARSREQAVGLIAAGRVTVAGRVASKPATAVDPAAAVVVRPESTGPDYVSRGGHKLAGALDTFTDVAVAGRRCLDAGACTGGFTDVLLRRGAREVVAADVGYGQLAWPIQRHPQVRILDRTNVRLLSVEAIGGPVQLVVADLSFISLRLVLPVLTGVLAAGGDLVPMVKPQFEVGRDRVGAGGIVRDPALRADAVVTVARAAGEHGWGVAGVVASPLPGAGGNVEYFLWLRADVPPADPTAAVQAAVAAGPQGAVAASTDPPAVTPEGDPVR